MKSIKIPHDIFLKLLKKIIFIFIILIILLGFFYGSTQYYSKMFAKENRVQEYYNQFQKQFAEQESQITLLADTTKTQAQVINTLQQTQTGFNRNDWRLLEAEFLIKLANDKLIFENNVAQAIRLLQKADAEVSSLNDANLLSIRKALAEDIVNLESVNKLDVPGIYSQLLAVNEQINKLSLLNKMSFDNKQIVSDKSLPWWKQGLLETWRGLQKIVVVRYHDSGKPPLVLPDEQNFLYLNLHSKIDIAIWALLHQDPVIYQSSLEQVDQWIKEYFLPDSAVTKNVLENIKQLQSLNIKPVVPDLSNSLKAFQDYFESHKQ